MKISVTLPNFNHARFLPRAIEGILAQTHRDWQLFIVDDGSSDESWQVIQRFQEKDSRISAERFAENRGGHAAIDNCRARCTGELLYAAAADDYICNPRFFGLAVSGLARHPGAAGVFGASRVARSENEMLWTMGMYGTQPAFIQPHIAVREFLDSQLFVPGTSSIWRRDMLESLGWYDEALGPQSDYYVNHALAMLHGVVSLNEVVSVTRLAEGSYSQAVNNEQFFRRHAMVEKRFRSLGGRTRLPDDGVHRWRQNIINGRLSFDRQMRLVRLWDEACANLQEWERAGLLSEFTESETYLKERCARLKVRLEAAKASAERAFDEIAGPLPLPTRTPSSARSVLRKIASFILRRAARMARGE
jgi:glycosyltransferase involved in cell wall biosynthesis